MSVITRPVPPAIGRPAAVPSDLIWRLSVDQYHKMIRTGILTEVVRGDTRQYLDRHPGPQD
ncbi:MAG: hypothetical protein ACE5LU_06245, partial [Anaerolineae bacterium]